MNCRRPSLSRSLLLCDIVLPNQRELCSLIHGLVNLKIFSPTPTFSYSKSWAYLWKNCETLSVAIFQEILSLRYSVRVTEVRSCSWGNEKRLPKCAMRDRRRKAGVFWTPPVNLHFEWSGRCTAAVRGMWRGAEQKRKECNWGWRLLERGPSSYRLKRALLTAGRELFLESLVGSREWPVQRLRLLLRPACWRRWVVQMHWLCRHALLVRAQAVQCFFPAHNPPTTSRWYLRCVPTNSKCANVYRSIYCLHPKERPTFFGWSTGRHRCCTSRV